MAILGTSMLNNYHVIKAEILSQTNMERHMGLSNLKTLQGQHVGSICSTAVCTWRAIGT